MHNRLSALLRILTLLAVVVAGSAAADDPTGAPNVQLMNPNAAGIVWYGDDYCSTWADVADVDGIGRIEFRLSTDDGATFPILLGSDYGVNFVDCVVPNIATTTARVKVIVSDTLGNTSFDVSDNPFTIRASALVVNLLSLSATRVVGGTPVQATVQLSNVAPEGGAAVALESSNPSAASVPASVTVPAGETSATFAVSTAEVAGTSNVTISASYGGATEVSTLTVSPVTAVAPQVASLSLRPTSVVAGKESLATVTLTEPALDGGAAIALSSSDPAVATVEESVVVPAGATSATFLVSSVYGSPFTTVTISASYGGATVSAPLTVTPSDAPRSIAILRADYTMSNGKLRVAARTSSETETLNVYVTATGELIGTLKSVGGGDYQGKFNWPTHPIQITVLSTTGATATARVRAR